MVHNHELVIQFADIGLVINRICDFTTLSMPIELLEYVECQLPVICSRMKTANFYFDDSMVYYFDDEEQLADIVDHIIANPDEAKEKAARAYSRYQEISWLVKQRSYVDFIEQAA